MELTLPFLVCSVFEGAILNFVVRRLWLSLIIVELLLQLNGKFWRFSVVLILQQCVTIINVGLF